MRNWQQLLDAAIATGAYEDYLGDGFTVPWQCFYSPYAEVLRFYKSYLDALYSPAARLHDWLYTPYGALIEVTRDEADQAIRDYILHIGGLTANLDAALVYQAVHQFGGPYFGRSQTGFERRTVGDRYWNGQTWVSVRNMGLAGASARVTKGLNMPIKVVMKFLQITEPSAAIPSIGLAAKQHMGSWTEHVWFGVDDVNILLQALQGGTSLFSFGLLPARATFLNSNALITGVTLYQGGAGKGQFRALAYPGLARKCDVPQMAILCNVGYASSTKTRSFKCKGIADLDVVGGEFRPNEFTRFGIETYSKALGYFGGYALGDPVRQPILNVAANGLITLNNVNVTNQVGDAVNVSQTLDGNGIRRSGTYLVTSVGPLGPQMTVTGWPWGDCRGGQVYMAPGKTFRPFTSSQFAVNRVAPGKIGRPSELYRGRRSKRRQPR